jgi:hypothetical protein
MIFVRRRIVIVLVLMLPFRETVGDMPSPERTVQFFSHRGRFSCASSLLAADNFRIFCAG